MHANQRLDVVNSQSCEKNMNTAPSFMRAFNDS